jgi:hypothetical protein
VPLRRWSNLLDKLTGSQGSQQATVLRNPSTEARANGKQQSVRVTYCDSFRKKIPISIFHATSLGLG